MNSGSFNAWSTVLLGGFLVSLALATAYLLAAVVGWRGPHRRTRLLRFALFLGLAPVLVVAQQALMWWVFLPSLGREQARQVQAQVDAVSHVKVGDRAPSFRLTDTNGRPFDLADQRGKVVLVNFFATWCGPCVQELPEIQRIWDEHQDHGQFALLVIGREESNESIAAFQKEHGFTFAAASDPDRVVYSLYAEKLIPRTYLVAQDGTICFSSTGFDEADLARLRQELATRLP